MSKRYIKVKKLPKYLPMEEDFIPIKHCFICGNEVFDTKYDTCSDICALQKEIFIEDCERDLMESILKWDEANE